MSRQFILTLMLSVCLLPAGSLSAQSSDYDPFAHSSPMLADSQVIKMADVHGYLEDMLRAEVVTELELYETKLDTALAIISDLLADDSVVEHPRFQETYRSVVSEYEGYYGIVDTLHSAFGEINQVRAAISEALEGDDLLEDLLFEELPEVETRIPITHNSLVERSITYLLRKPEKTIDLWRTRAETYFPMIETILEEEGAPEELKYLALIESGLEPRARSWARAAGMWQFIYATGRMYGLEVNAWADERLDPEKSTRAAARHLNDLYELFGGDWTLALAGYNCSPGRVKRAIRRVRRANGGDPDFWDIYRYLPRETRGYVPMFMAASIVMSHPETFELKDVEAGPRYEFDIVPVHHMLELSTVAEMTGTSVAAIRALNPEIRTDFVPPSSDPYMLRIPLRTSAKFAAAYEEWMSDYGGTTLTHVVRSGDTIGRVARQYGVSIGALRSANGLPDNTIHIGQQLDIPIIPYASKSAQEMFTRGAGSYRYRAPSIDPVVVAKLSESAEGIRTVAVRSQQRAEQMNGGSSAPEPSGNRIRYRVRSGDTLSEIAGRYGTTVGRLKSWNNLRSSRIRVGQVLTIYSNGAAPAASPGATTHRVRRGETLTGIAATYGTTIRRLMSWNNLSSSRIYVGQNLRVRAPQEGGSGEAVTHVVRRGHTLTAIARRYGVSVTDIKTWNNLSSSRIYVGQRLTIYQ